MNILPKWFNKWLTPEEEDAIKDPGRRAFSLGMAGLVGSLWLPKGVEKLIEIVSPPEIEIAFPASASASMALEIERIRDKLPLLFERDEAFFKAATDNVSTAYKTEGLLRGMGFRGVKVKETGKFTDRSTSNRLEAEGEYKTSDTLIELSRPWQEPKDWKVFKE